MEGTAGINQRSDSAEFLEGHSQAGLQMDSEKLASIRSANDSRASGEQTGSDSESVLIRDIRGKNSSALSAPKAQVPSDWVYALKDVSFEVKRGEVLGIIGRNGAGTQAAGQPRGKLPQAARRVRRRGKARINSTLLKILSRVTMQSSGQIKVTQARGAGRAEIGCRRHARRALRTGRSANQILIVDEVLAVGDAEFQKKCLGKMKDVPAALIAKS